MIHSILPLVVVLAALGCAPGSDASAQDAPGSQKTPGDPPIPECSSEEITLPSGLRYCILHEGGGGESPSRGDMVRVDYTGWTTDGKSFDSSRKPRRPGMAAEPAEFPVGGLIEGWNEALTLMSPGSHWRLFIPAALGYGASGSPPAIGPNQDLIFEVELHAITNKVPRFLEWNAEADGVVALENGMAYKVIDAGKGPTIEETGQGNVAFGLYNQAGELLTSHTMNRAPKGIPLMKDQVPLAFFQDLLPVLRTGAELQVSVPAKLGAGSQGGLDKLAEGETEIWMLSVGQLRPMFRIPAAEELTTTESGLQYTMLVEGTGKAVTRQDSVEVEYCGWFTDGECFDASFNRGQTASFGVTQVIPGWTEGLQLMKEGGEAIFVIPSELAYGSNPRPGFRKDADLVFYVKVVKVL